MSVDLKELATLIIRGEISGTKRLNLQEFKTLYREVEQAAQAGGRQIKETRILILTETSLVRFSIAPRYILRIIDNRALHPSDFDIVLSPKFEGNIQPILLRDFLWSVVRKNWWILVPIFLIFLFLLWQDAQFSALQTINQMLVEANALFIGIFVLFTISQNRDLLASPELVRQGITHQLMQNDVYIAGLSIASLILAFLSTAFAGAALSIVGFELPIIGWSINLGNWARVLTTFSIVLLVECLLAVSRYYIRVMRTALEGRMYRELLSGRSEKSHRQK